jgi:hypothetical protein
LALALPHGCFALPSHGSLFRKTETITPGVKLSPADECREYLKALQETVREVKDQLAIAGFRIKTCDGARSKDAGSDSALIWFRQPKQLEAGNRPVDARPPKRLPPR